MAVSAKTNNLQPTDRADGAVKYVLQRLYDSMLVNEPGTRAGADPEYLHDYRVCVRMTRSALSQFRHLFPKRDVERFRREFAWLGDVTSPLRDLDVHLMELDTQLQRLPAESVCALRPFHDLMKRERQLAQTTLVGAMDSNRYQRLLAAWSAFLEKPLPSRTPLADATRPINMVARERIWASYKKVIKRGRKLGRKSSAGEVHEFRKTCKKLRYLIELFRGLFPADICKRIIKALKHLQDRLGEFQDCQVQAIALRKYRKVLVQSAAPAETLANMDAIMRSLKKQEKRSHAKCLKQFDRFDRKKIRGLFSSGFNVKSAMPYR